METKEQKDSGEDSPRGGVVGLGAAAGIEHEEGSPLKNANLTADICVECGEPSNFPCYKCGCGSLYCGNTADNGCWIFQRSKWEGALGEDSSKINWLVEKYPDGVCYECAIDALGDEADDSSGEDDEDSSGSENDDDSGSGDSSFVPGTESEPESESASGSEHESNTGSEDDEDSSGGEGDDSSVEGGAGLSAAVEALEQAYRQKMEALEKRALVAERALEVLRAKVFEVESGECEWDRCESCPRGDDVILPGYLCKCDGCGYLYCLGCWEDQHENLCEDGFDENLCCYCNN